MASRKGIPNKLGKLAKENIAAVFIRLGGTAAMAEWAKENKTDFYRIYSKLMPVEQHIAGPDGQELKGLVVLPAKDGQSGR